MAEAIITIEFIEDADPDMAVLKAQNLSSMLGVWIRFKIKGKEFLIHSNK